MILKAIEAMALAVCEVSPSGGCEGLEVLLPEPLWRSLEMEMRARELQRQILVPPTVPDHGLTMVRLYTPGGEVLVKRKP